MAHGPCVCHLCSISFILPLCSSLKTPYTLMPQNLCICICGSLYMKYFPLYICMAYSLTLLRSLFKDTLLLSYSKNKLFKNLLLHWLVWLSVFSTSLRTKGSLVQFPIRAHAWIVGPVPCRGCMRGNHTLMFLSLSPPLSKNK